MARRGNENLARRGNGNLAEQGVMMGASLLFPRRLVRPLSRRGPQGRQIAPSPMHWSWLSRPRPSCPRVSALPSWLAFLPLPAPLPSHPHLHLGLRLAHLWHMEFFKIILQSTGGVEGGRTFKVTCKICFLSRRLVFQRGVLRAIIKRGGELHAAAS